MEGSFWVQDLTFAPDDDHCPTCYPLGCDCSDAQRPPERRDRNDPYQCKFCSYYGEACPSHFE